MNPNTKHEIYPRKHIVLFVCEYASEFNRHHQVACIKACYNNWTLIPVTDVVHDPLPELVLGNSCAVWPIYPVFMGIRDMEEWSEDTLQVTQRLRHPEHKLNMTIPYGHKLPSEETG